MSIKDKIKDAFKQLTVERKGPHFSIPQLEDTAGLDAGTFHKMYRTKGIVLEEIWIDYFAEALDMARSDKVYADYISRQKLLAFYYSLIEVMRPDRDFIDTMLDARPFYEWTPRYLEPLKSAFIGHIKELVNEGIAIEEVEARIKLADYYVEPHWYQFLFIVSFWTGDASVEYEKTDEAIEKSVNLGFDLMGRNVLDTAFEFGKFWYQNR